MLRPIPEHSKLLNNYHSYIVFIHYVSYYSHSCAVYYHPCRCSSMFVSVFFMVTCFSYFCLVLLFLFLFSSVVFTAVTTPVKQRELVMNRVW